MNAVKVLNKHKKDVEKLIKESKGSLNTILHAHLKELSDLINLAKNLAAR